MDELKARFLEVYANIPSSLRDDVIVVLDEKTYTWDTVYIEVLEDTELSKEMLKSLKDLGIIQNDRQ